MTPNQLTCRESEQKEAGHECPASMLCHKPYDLPDAAGVLMIAWYSVDVS